MPSVICILFLCSFLSSSFQTYMLLLLFKSTTPTLTFCTVPCLSTLTVLTIFLIFYGMCIYCRRSTSIRCSYSHSQGCLFFVFSFSLTSVFCLHLRLFLFEIVFYCINHVSTGLCHTVLTHMPTMSISCIKLLYINPHVKPKL